MSDHDIENVSEELNPTIELEAGAGAVAMHRRRGLFFVGLAVGLAGFAMTLQLALNSNFVADEIGVSAFQQGLLETVRETAGIWALGILALLAGLAEPLVGMAMLVVFGVGLGSLSWVPDYFWLVSMSMLWSQGLHVWMPLPHSMTLALAEPGRAGHRLGQIRAASAIGAGLSLVMAIALHKLGVAIRPLYLLAGGAGVLAGAACLGVPRKIKTPGPRLVLRRAYSLYYLLQFLEGWRKQIFVAFAGFLLVRRYGTPLETMLALWLAIQAISWLVSPLVGRLIDRLGERRILMFYYASLTVFFLGYAFVPNPYVLYALFIIDSAFFVFTMALTTYVNRIAPPADHTATLSMGVAFNHVAAVSMPFVGGLLWDKISYQWVFIVGAAAALVSAGVALRVPTGRVPTADEASAGS